MSIQKVVDWSHVGKANADNFIQENIDYFREFYKKNKRPPGFKAIKSNAGSQNFGALKDGLITLSWKPPFVGPGTGFAEPIATTLAPTDFKNKVQQVFRVITEESEKYFKKYPNLIDKYF
jgi:hypothetical protein